MLATEASAKFAVVRSYFARLQYTERPVFNHAFDSLQKALADFRVAKIQFFDSDDRARAESQKQVRKLVEQDKN